MCRRINLDRGVCSWRETARGGKGAGGAGEGCGVWKGWRPARLPQNRRQ